MSQIIKRFSAINQELEFGVIYVVVPAWIEQSSNDYLWTSVQRLLHVLKKLTRYEIKIIDLPNSRGITLVARRINVGNSGTDAVVEMPLSNSDSLLIDFHHFASIATNVTSTESGDSLLTQYVNRNEQLIQESRSSVRESQASKKHNLNNWLKFNLRVGEAYDSDHCEVCSPSMEPLEVDEEETQLDTLEQEQQQALKDIEAKILEYVIKYHANPEQLFNTLLKGKFVIGNNNNLSPIVVNNDLKIVLPGYNEVEVKMRAMPRTIYILFLKHPEGIILRNIANYRDEIENIYSIVMPGRNEDMAKKSIDNLLDPMSNTLNEYIAKIKRNIKLYIIDEQIANNYIITGKRNEPYRISIDPALIKLPRAITA